MWQTDMVGPAFDSLRRTQHYLCVIPAKNVKPECNLEEISVNHKLKVIQQSSRYYSSKVSSEKRQEKTEWLLHIEGGYRDMKTTKVTLDWILDWEEKDNYKEHFWNNQ